MYRDVLTNIDFFRHRPQRFLAHIGPYLKVLKIGKFEYICTEGEYANEMYFIRQGVVEIVLKEFNNFPFMIIEKGYFFGEIDLLFGETRKHSYRAETDCELLSINKKEFTKIFFEEFSDIGGEIYDNALKRRARQNTSYKEAYAYCQKQAKEANKKKFEPKKTIIPEGKLLNFKGKEKLRQLVKMARDPAKKDLLHKDEPEGEQNQEILAKKEGVVPSIQIPKSQNEIPEKSETLKVEELPPDGEENSSENPLKRKAKGWAFLQKGKALGTIVKSISTNNNNSLENQIEVLNKNGEF
jgi:CRP-like cAMP-binding protein